MRTPLQCIPIVAVRTCDIVLSAKKPVSDAYPKNPKTIGDHLKKRRMDLKVTKDESARHLRVSTCSLNNWERDRFAPDVQHFPKIIAFLGYVPWDTSCKTISERVIKQRKQLGLNQRQLAQATGMSPETISAWEKGRARPSPLLLRVLAAYFAHGGRPITTRNDL